MIDPVKVVLEMLKRSGVTTDLDNDIIDTAKKLHKQPFSREDAQKKILENDIKHPDIAITISNIPGTVRKRFCEFSEDELKITLQNQLLGLWNKKIMELKRTVFSGSTLKIIALVIMFIDHVGAVIVQRTMSMPGFDHNFWSSLYWPLRYVGRLAFPIFCFLLVFSGEMYSLLSSHANGDE